MVGVRWTMAFSHTALPCGTRRRGGVAVIRQPSGGGFPAHEKCPAPMRRAGHFRVRLSGRYNALYLAAPWGLQGVRPGTPRDPVLRLRLRWKRALTGPQPAPLCRRFCRPSLGVGVYPSWAAKTRLRADGGRRTGVIAETKTAPAIPRRRCHTWDAICCEYL